MKRIALSSPTYHSSSLKPDLNLKPQQITSCFLPAPSTPPFSHVTPSTRPPGKLSLMSGLPYTRLKTPAWIIISFWWVNHIAKGSDPRRKKDLRNRKFRHRDSLRLVINHEGAGVRSPARVFKAFIVPKILYSPVLIISDFVNSTQHKIWPL